MSTFDLDDYAEARQQGLWPGALEGRWELELLAWRRLWHAVGYHRKGCCNSTWGRHNRPLHYWVENARSFSFTLVLEKQRLYNERRYDSQPASLREVPMVRAAELHRDGFGRFLGYRARTYVWRADFDRLIEWYKVHVVEVDELRAAETAHVLARTENL